MINSLFNLRLKQRIQQVWPWFVCFFAAGALSVYLFTPARLSDIQLLRQELPELLTFLGILGEGSIGIYISGVLLGFVLPLLVMMFSLSSAKALVAKPIEDGRMAMLLASSYRREKIAFTLIILCFFETIIILIANLVGQLLGVMLLFSDVSLLPLLRLNIAAALVMTVFPALSCLIAFASNNSRRTAQIGRIGMVLTLLFTGLSRMPGWLRMFRFITPLTWLKPTQWLAGSGGWISIMYACMLSAILTLISIAVFSQKEL